MLYRGSMVTVIMSCARSQKSLKPPIDKGHQVYSVQFFGASTLDGRHTSLSMSHKFEHELDSSLKIVIAELT